MDVLYGLGQGICIAGLLYGAYLAITHVERDGPRDAKSGQSPLQVNPQVKPRTGYDALAGHVWTTTRSTVE